MKACPSCGHLQPEPDSTCAERDAFMEDDSTKKCGLCSAVWIALFSLMFAEARADAAAKKAIH